MDGDNCVSPKRKVYSFCDSPVIEWGMKSRSKSAARKGEMRREVEWENLKRRDHETCNLIEG